MIRRTFLADRLAQIVTELRVDPDEALYWAEKCGWMPGTGRCTARDICSAECIFAASRGADELALRFRRMSRRASQNPRNR